MFNSIGFIGAGRIAHILLGGWQHSQTQLPDVIVHDQSPEAIAALQADFPSVRAGTLAEAAGQALVFGALHPPALKDALPQIAKQLQPDAVFCSLAPVIRLPALQQLLGGFPRLARMNPNAPSIVGVGYNPVSFASGFAQDARTAFLNLMAPLGACPEVEDALIETYAVVSAMGPTYFWFQFDELRKMAESWQMDPAAAREAIACMLHGAVSTLFGHDLPPEKVLDLVPVRPMGADEEAIRGMMRASIGGIYTKLH